MYKYSVQIKKVRGKINESKSPKKNLVIKSKKALTENAVFEKASSYLKKKYNLVLESADVQGSQEGIIRVYVGTWSKYICRYME